MLTKEDDRIDTNEIVYICCLALVFSIKVFPKTLEILAFSKRKSRRSPAPRRRKSTNEQEYSDVCLEFESVKILKIVMNIYDNLPNTPQDYDRANPLTKQEALQEWLRKLELKKRKNNKREEDLRTESSKFFNSLLSCLPNSKPLKLNVSESFRTLEWR
jgi:hypothetical protein